MGFWPTKKVTYDSLDYVAISLNDQNQEQGSSFFIVSGMDGY